MIEQHPLQNIGTFSYVNILLAYNGNGGIACKKPVPRTEMFLHSKPVGIWVENVAGMRGMKKVYRNLMG
jgi:hypothetical protein